MSIRVINLVSFDPKKYKEHYAPKGDRKRPTYIYKLDEKYGCPRRVLNGYIDQHEFIQQSKDDVDFKSIGQMLVDNRDNVVSHFTDNNGEIVDVTGLPRNVHEYSSLFNKLKKQFDEMPADMRSLFNDDFNVFHDSYKKGTIGSTLDTYFKAQSSSSEPQPQPEPEKENKTV